MKTIAILILLQLMIIGCSNINATKINNKEKIIKHTNAIYISKRKISSDFEKLFNILENYHPNLYKYISKEEYVEAKLNLTNSIENNIRREIVILKVRDFLTKINDGHTFLETYSNKKDIPIEIFINKELQTIVRNNERLPYGSEILEINGEPIKDINTKLLKYISGDTLEQKIARLYKEGYWELLSYKYLDSDLMEIKYLNKDKEYSDKVMFELSNSRQKENRYYFTENKDIMVLELNTFEIKESKVYEEYLENFFEILEKNKINKLIIDIRNNNGGRWPFLYHLLEYLTEKPIELHKITEIKISKDGIIDMFYQSMPNEFARYFSKIIRKQIEEEYLTLELWEKKLGKLEYNKEEIKELYRIVLRNQGMNEVKIEEVIKEEEKNGRILPEFNFGQNNSTEEKRDLENRYKGKSVLLIGNYSYSASVTFANKYKEYKIGTVIGEKTGGTTEIFGDIQPINLPGMDVNVYVPISRYYNEKNSFEVVEPDILVANDLENLRKKEDMVLDKAIEVLTN